MKKILVYAVSSTLLLNSFQVAMAAEINTKQVEKTIDRVLSEKEIIAMSNSIDSKTTQELVEALNEVKSLMGKLNDISNTTDSDVILKYANKTQVVLVSLTALTMRSHFKSAETTNAILALSVASMGLNTFISHYKQTNKVDATLLSQIVFDSSRELSKSGDLSPEIEKITASLNTISSSLLENQSQITSLVSNLGGTQDMALLASFSYLLLHLIAPRIAKETDGFMKNVLPKIQQGLTKGTEIAKKPIAIGATSAAGIPDILGMTLGLSSEQSHKLILATRINLDSTANKLIAEISARSAKK